MDHTARLGIDLEVVRRAPGTKGFVVLPRRWVVEGVLGQLMHRRRLARDYEALLTRSTAMICIALIALMTRRKSTNPHQPGEEHEPHQVHGTR